MAYLGGLLILAFITAGTRAMAMRSRHAQCRPNGLPRVANQLFHFRSHILAINQKLMAFMTIATAMAGAKTLLPRADWLTALNEPQLHGAIEQD